MLSLAIRLLFFTFYACVSVSVCMCEKCVLKFDLATLATPDDGAAADDDDTVGQCSIVLLHIQLSNVTHDV